MCRQWEEVLLKAGVVKGPLRGPFEVLTDHP